MEKNITDKDSGLCTIKILSSIGFTQAALTCSRAEQKLLLQSLYLEKLCWIPSLFCLQKLQRLEVGLRAWQGDLQRCCFPSPCILPWGRGGLD